MSNSVENLLLNLFPLFYHGVLAVFIATLDAKARPRPTSVQSLRALGYLLLSATYVSVLRTIFGSDRSLVGVDLNIKVLCLLVVMLIHAIAFIAAINRHVAVFAGLLLFTFTLFVSTQLIHNPLLLGWSLVAHLAVTTLIYALWKPLNLGHELGLGDRQLKKDAQSAAKSVKKE